MEKSATRRTGSGPRPITSNIALILRLIYTQVRLARRHVRLPPQHLPVLGMTVGVRHGALQMVAVAVVAEAAGAMPPPPAGERAMTTDADPTPRDMDTIPMMAEEMAETTTTSTTETAARRRRLRLQPYLVKRGRATRSRLQASLSRLPT